MLYIHIPFCERKCDYCDFLSFATDEATKAGYFKALFEQTKLKAELAGNIPVSSVFIGGGTPSCVDERYIYNLLEVIKEKYLLEADAEITMEANPNSIRKNALDVYREAGINRLSIGLQSTNNEELKLLSRLHTYEDFLQAYDLVRNAGFTNVNIDLMSGLPDQSPASFEKSLKKVVNLNPEHISAYSLIIEEGTRFFEKYSGKDELFDEEADRDMYHMTGDILSDYGYARYEISNYAKKGFECKHNMGYWERRPYLGMGISAASLFKETRYTNHGDIKKYIEGDFSQTREELTIRDCMAEFMFLGLRMTKGVSKEEFFKSFSVDYDEIYKEVTEKLVREGLLESAERIFLTEKGLDLANYAMAEFLMD